MGYANGFVAAVPTTNKEVYRKHAEEAAKVFKEFGALALVEYWGDDVPEGKITSFPMAVKCREDETVRRKGMTDTGDAIRRKGTAMPGGPVQH